MMKAFIVCVIFQVEDVLIVYYLVGIIHIKKHVFIARQMLVVILKFVRIAIDLRVVNILHMDMQVHVMAEYVISAKEKKRKQRHVVMDTI